MGKVQAEGTTYTKAWNHDFLLEELKTNTENKQKNRLGLVRAA